MRLQSTFKRVTLAATGVALALGLSACSAQPGVALKVDDATYTEDEVSQAAQQLTEVSGQLFPVSGVVYMLAQEPALREVASQNGINFSEDDARNALASVEEITGQPPVSAAVTTVRANQLYNLLGQSPNLDQVVDQLAKAMANKDIEVNPRFGTLGDNNALYTPQLNGVVDQALLAEQ